MSRRAQALGFSFAKRKKPKKEKQNA